jgi:hypothetical protein
VTVGKANVGVAVMVGVNVIVGVNAIVEVLMGVNVASGVKVNAGVCVSVGGAGVGVKACEGRLQASMASTKTKTTKYFLLI